MAGWSITQSSRRARTQQQQVLSETYYCDSQLFRAAASHASCQSQRRGWRLLLIIPNEERMREENLFARASAISRP